MLLYCLAERTPSWTKLSDALYPLAARDEVVGEEVAQGDGGVAVDDHGSHRTPVVGDSGRVSHQHPGRDGGGVRRVVDLEVEVVADRVVESQLARLDEVHESDSGDRLGDRGQHEGGPRGDGAVLLPVGQSVALAPQRVFAAGDAGGQAGHIRRLQLGLDDCVECGELRVVPGSSAPGGTESSSGAGPGVQAVRARRSRNLRMKHSRTEGTRVSGRGASEDHNQLTFSDLPSFKPNFA